MRSVPSLTLFMGPMWSGKSAALIRAVAAARSEGRRVAAVQHVLETRYGAGTIGSRTGLSMQADITVSSLDSLALGEGFLYDCIAIDEAQFFGASLLRLYERCTSGLLPGGLIVSGLDLDYRQDAFGDLSRLAELALRQHAPITIQRLAARCGCGAPAPFTQRLLPRGGGDARPDGVVLVGGAELYAPSCAAHHSPRPVEQAAWAGAGPSAREFR